MPHDEGVVDGGVVGDRASLPTDSHVADLVDDMLVFQSDTRHTMFGLVSVVGVVAIAALAIALAMFFR